MLILLVRDRQTWKSRIVFVLPEILVTIIALVEGAPCKGHVGKLPVQVETRKRGNGKRNARKDDHDQGPRMCDARRGGRQGRTLRKDNCDQVGESAGEGQEWLKAKSETMPGRRNPSGGITCGAWSGREEHLRIMAHRVTPHVSRHTQN